MLRFQKSCSQWNRLSWFDPSCGFVGMQEPYPQHLLHDSVFKLKNEIGLIEIRDVSILDSIDNSVQNRKC